MKVSEFTDVERGISMFNQRKKELVNFENIPTQELEEKNLGGGWSKNTTGRFLIWSISHIYIYIFFLNQLLKCSHFYHFLAVLFNRQILSWSQDEQFKCFLEWQWKYKCRLRNSKPNQPNCNHLSIWLTFWNKFSSAIPSSPWQVPWHLLQPQNAAKQAPSMNNPQCWSPADLGADGLWIGAYVTPRTS